jgi:hypothetical protein
VCYYCRNVPHPGAGVEKSINKTCILLTNLLLTQFSTGRPHENSDETTEKNITDLDCDKTLGTVVYLTTPEGSGRELTLALSRHLPDVLRKATKNFSQNRQSPGPRAYEAGLSVSRSRRSVRTAVVAGGFPHSSM